MSGSEDVFAQLKGKSLVKGRVGIEKFVEVEFKNRVRRNIRGFLVETSMNVDVVLDHEGNMTETIDVG